MIKQCHFCKREFYGGQYTEQVIPMGGYGRFCEACALAACEAVDNLRVQAIALVPGWVGIPEVEWTAIMSQLTERV